MMETTGAGRHGDLDGMTYGDLYDTFLMYDKVAVLDEVTTMTEARMGAWKLAQDEGMSVLDSRMAGLRAAIIAARELGL